MGWTGSGWLWGAREGRLDAPCPESRAREAWGAGLRRMSSVCLLDGSAGGVTVETDGAKK